VNITAWGSKLVVPVSPAHDHIRGPVNAPVTLLKYGDYECSYCGAAHVIVNAIQVQMRHELRFVFRHFPVTTVHPHAEIAAEAAEAAAAQGSFWPMHDVLYANQDRLALPYLLGYAEALGLDVHEFREALGDHRHAARVHDHFMSGVRSGVNGTPTFYINGVRHDGAWDFETLLAALEQAAVADLGA
jgi:protein-disulfide isomerase